MALLPPAIAAFAEGLRQELAAHDHIGELMVEQVVCAAVRIKLLLADPRAYDVSGESRDWNRDHDEATRSFFRNYNALLRRDRQPSSSNRQAAASSTRPPSPSARSEPAPTPPAATPARPATTAPPVTPPTPVAAAPVESSRAHSDQRTSRAPSTTASATTPASPRAVDSLEAKLFRGPEPDVFGFTASSSPGQSPASRASPG